jgi:hypothetical protein
MNGTLRCQDCEDVIGVYEPMIVLIDGQARSTSRAAEKDTEVLVSVLPPRLLQTDVMARISSANSPRIRGNRISPTVYCGWRTGRAVRASTQAQAAERALAFASRLRHLSEKENRDTHI